ncbi:hypothetical protein A2982_00130 [candidate division WWE3 bacterium RIFCSPLOWO2_01_FULL_39_13]|uniref:Uncharacterized protein n=1 Tax=candidate division WWE3 bacterium RIFCSPLOWO2_01_FULL_39_13 TaxID=1802624 RepID=A0A1F4V4P0_UNCKA|nr:MAG: hypothetical protein A2982_00130 [candidate division WWE3 bacterium RIFCSPLOWO2_01_FULL_39_13]
MFDGEYKTAQAVCQKHANSVKKPIDTVKSMQKAGFWLVNNLNVKSDPGFYEGKVSSFGQNIEYHKKPGRRILKPFGVFN